MGSVKAKDNHANIMSKIKNGKYIALDKVESICKALDCTPNDILEFISED